MKLKDLCFPFQITAEIIKELQDEDIRNFWNINKETFKAKYIRKKKERLLIKHYNNISDDYFI
jgi:hypothetical protein